MRKSFKRSLSKKIASICLGINACGLFQGENENARANSIGPVVTTVVLLLGGPTVDCCAGGPLSKMITTVLIKNPNAITQLYLKLNNIRKDLPDVPGDFDPFDFYPEKAYAEEKGAVKKFNDLWSEIYAKAITEDEQYFTNRWKLILDRPWDVKTYITEIMNRLAKNAKKYGLGPIEGDVYWPSKN